MVSVNGSRDGTVRSRCSARLLVCCCALAVRVVAASSSSPLLPHHGEAAWGEGFTRSVRLWRRAAGAATPYDSPSVQGSRSQPAASRRALLRSSAERQKRLRRLAPPPIKPAEKGGTAAGPRGLQQPQALRLKVFTSQSQKKRFNKAESRGETWKHYLTEENMRLTWKRLKSNTGSERPGRIKGSPSPSEFRWEDVQQMCNQTEEPLDVRSLPLSLDDSVDPQEILVTKAIADDIYTKLRTWKHYVTSMKKRMAISTESLFPAAQKYSTCAIVGNHGNLLHSKYGEQIDKHDVVVRMNRGPTKGYVRRVGSKTTFRVMNNAESRVFASKGYRGLHKETLPIRDNVTMVVSRVPPEFVGPYLERMYQWIKVDQGLTGVQFSMLSRKFLAATAYILKTFRRCVALQKDKDLTRWGKFKSASSGLTMLMGFLHLCNHVTVYGIGEDMATPTTPYQYFANWHPNPKARPEKVSYGAANTEAHNFRLERKWIESMASANLLRKCEATRCYGKPEPDSLLVEADTPSASPLSL